MRAAASVFVARAAGGPGFTDSARSRGGGGGGGASDEVTSALSKAFLASGRPDDSCAVDSGDPEGSRVVARSSSLRVRNFSRSGVPTARVMV